MNITFLIGNGFDINLGLATRYSDFYESLSQNKNNNQIYNKIQENAEKWSDLEKALGEFTKNKNECDILKFDEDFESLCEDLSKYLKMQQKTFHDFTISLKEKDIFINNGFKTFYNDLVPNSKKKVISCLEKFGNQNWLYNFISFNFTDTLDYYIHQVAKSSWKSELQNKNVTAVTAVNNNVLHLHGKLNEQLYLGVNDKDQISSDLPDFQDYIKTDCLMENGSDNETRFDELLKNSQVIISFGLSLGETDKTWFKKVIDWLKAGDNRFFIVYKYDLKYRSFSQRSYPKSKRNLIHLLSENCGFDVNDENITNKILLTKQDVNYTFKTSPQFKESFEAFRNSKNNIIPLNNKNNSQVSN